MRNPGLVKRCVRASELPAPVLSPHTMIVGARLGKDVALITDGRFSGGSHGSSWGTSLPRHRKAAQSRWSALTTERPSTPEARVVIETAAGEEAQITCSQAMASRPRRVRERCMARRL